MDEPKPEPLIIDADASLDSNYSIKFFDAGMNEMLCLDSKGFTYMGARIIDAGTAHDLFVKVMEGMRPKPTTLEMELREVMGLSEDAGDLVERVRAYVETNRKQSETIQQLREQERENFLEGVAIQAIVGPGTETEKLSDIVARVVGEMRRAHARGRWNVETTADGIKVCEGHHERSEGCQWIEYKRL